jgi:hypothetical protein
LAIASQFYALSLEESQQFQSLSALLKRWKRQLDVKWDIASEWTVKEVARPSFFTAQQELSFVDYKKIET